MQASYDAAASVLADIRASAAACKAADEEAAAAEKQRADEHFQQQHTQLSKQVRALHTLALRADETAGCARVLSSFGVHALFRMPCNDSSSGGRSSNSTKLCRCGMNAHCAPIH